MRALIFGADDPKWPEALARLRHDVYHLPAYAQLEERRLGARAEAISIRDGDRELFVPYLVRSCADVAPADLAGAVDVISPYGYPGVLVSDAGRTRDFVVPAFERWREALAERGACSGFFRMHPILEGNLAELAPVGSLLDVGATVAVDLERSEMEVRRGAREAHRVTARKARDAGYGVREIPLAGAIDAVCEIYRQTMDRVGAADSYYFDGDYFARLASTLPAQLLVAELGGETAAACVFTECQGIVQAHLGGTSDAHLAKSPFHLLLFEAAVWAKSRGNRYLHLGGGVGGKEDGLFQFKSGFSPLRFRFRTHRTIVNEATYSRLVEHRAAIEGKSSDALLSGDYFPAYRAVP
jgi:GNAT acetyltransferase-like protein